MGLIAGVGVGSYLLLSSLYLYITLPSIDDPRSLIASQSTVITDRNDIELYRLFQEEDRTYVPRSEIADHIVHALIAIEDERYYEHGCIDLKAIARAFLKNLLQGTRQGASTLTQQLARNALGLTREKLFSRKIREVMLACSLEGRYDKEQILEMYLNWIPFGQNAYGIEQASQTYFSIPAKDLTLAQAAILAALPQRPSYFNPYGKHLRTEVGSKALEAIRRGSITKTSDIPEEEITIGLLGSNIDTGTRTLYIAGRVDYVLKNMQKLGYISEQERLAALAETETTTFQPARESIRAPHFVLWIRQQLQDLLGGALGEGILEQGGLRIETTLDWELQKIAEDSVARHREDIQRIYGAWNIALLALEPGTREILAYVGNANYEDEEHQGKVDMVRAPRQPGSSFKPIVYATAFERGFSPAHTLYDVPTKIGDDEPQNFDGKFWGLLTIRRALGASRNIPAAKAFFLAGGEESILELAARIGAPTPKRSREELRKGSPDGFEYGWPLALGAAETPLLEMVQAYATFQDSGKYKNVVSIKRVVDRHGNILFEEPSKPPEQVLDPRIAYQIISILSDESARPAGFWRTQLSIPGFQTAAKTGTSNKCMERDEETDECLLRKPDNAWVLGYTPQLVSGVWAGNADSSALYEKGDGLNTASPIWKDFMVRAHRGFENPKTSFDAPPGIVQPQVSLLSGELPTECTPVELRRAEVFLEEHAPKVYDTACTTLTVDRVTGLLASKSCPEEAQEEQRFLAVRSLLSDRFPEWQESAETWAKEQTVLWNATPNHSGSLLPLPLAPKEFCDLSLTPGREVKPTLQILSPKEGGEATYPSFTPQLEIGASSQIRDATFLLDGKEVLRGSGALRAPTINVPRSLAKEGMHTLTVTITDRYFNQMEKSTVFRFTEDRSPPTIKIVEPEEGRTFLEGAELVITVEASDAEGALKYVQFYIGDLLLTTRPKEPYELRYTLTIDPGTYTLRAVATDMAKNTAEDSVTITVK